MTPRRYKFAVGTMRREGHAGSDGLDTDIWSLEWSVRVANALVNLNIRTVRDLMTINKSDLRRMPNFGEKSLREIEQVLSRHGLRLD